MATVSRPGRSRTAHVKSKIPGSDNLAAGPRDQRGQDGDAHGGVEEVHRAVSERGVGPAGVKAVDFALVRAVDCTRPGARLRREIETHQNDAAVIGSPWTALDHLVRTRLTQEPLLWSASIF